MLWAEVEPNRVAPVRLPPSADRVVCGPRNIRSCAEALEGSRVAFAFCGALLSIYPLDTQSLSVTTDVWKADRSPPTALSFPGSPC